MRTSSPVTSLATGCQTYLKKMTLIDRKGPKRLQFGEHPQLKLTARFRVIRGEMWLMLWPPWFQVSPRVPVYPTL